MWATESIDGKDSNGLDAVAAGAGAVLAVFLLLGGAGHLVATWPGGFEASPLRWLPGLFLLGAAVFNGLSCPFVWRGHRGWQAAALGLNAALALYLGRLLVDGPPDHPIGMFLAVVCSDLILLIAVLAGLEWRPLED